MLYTNWFFTTQIFTKKLFPISPKKNIVPEHDIVPKNDICLKRFFCSIRMFLGKTDYPPPKEKSAKIKFIPEKKFPRIHFTEKTHYCSEGKISTFTFYSVFFNFRGEQIFQLNEGIEWLFSDREIFYGFLFIGETYFLVSTVCNVYIYMIYILLRLMVLFVEKELVILKIALRKCLRRGKNYCRMPAFVAWVC